MSLPADFPDVPDLPPLQVGDEIALDANTKDQRLGKITAKSRHVPPSYAVALTDPEHEGTIEYDVHRQRLMLASEAPLLIGTAVVVDAGTPNERLGTIHAIKRSMPPTYIVDVRIGLGRSKTEFDVERARLTRAPQSGGSCAVM